MGRKRGRLAAVAIVALAVGWAPPGTARAPAVRVDVHRAGCRFSVRVCADAAAHGGLARLRLGGSRTVTKRVVAALRAVPGGRAVRRGAAFSPSWHAGCAAPITVEVPRGRVVVRGVTAAGARARARARLRCGADQPPSGGELPVGDPGPAPDPGPVEPPPPDPGGPGEPQPDPDPTPPPLRFTRVTIDSEGGGQVTESVATGDLDGDGRPDVVVAGDERLIWYRSPGWALEQIASGRFGAGAMTVVRDVDGDGRMDVVTGARDALETRWYRNTPDGWESHVLASDAYCHDLEFGDLDGDGRADAACVDQHRRRVVWLAAPADPTATWRLREVDGDENAMGAAIADIDGDGRADIVAGRAWYRNGGPDTWTRYPFTSVRIDGYDYFTNYARVNVLDLDGDGRLDVFATLYAETPAGRAYAFLAPADPRSAPWTEVVVDPTPLFGVHSQVVARFDGSNRPQVMVGETNIGGFGFGTNPSPQLYVYRLLGAAADPAAWERTTIDTVGTHEAQAVDLDGDGLPDLVGHDENTDLTGTNGPVQAWQNDSRG
jgi:hypothetical protein